MCPVHCDGLFDLFRQDMEIARRGEDRLAPLALDTVIDHIGEPGLAKALSKSEVRADMLPTLISGVSREPVCLQSCSRCLPQNNAVQISLVAMAPSMIWKAMVNVRLEMPARSRLPAYVPAIVASEAQATMTA